MNKSKSRVLIANPVLYSLLYSVSTVNIDYLSGHDGDSMIASGGHHPINQNPRPGAWLELQDLIQVFSIIST